MNDHITTLQDTAECGARPRLVGARLDDLIQDDAFQIRSSINGATVRRYTDAMRAGVQFPPITIGRINEAPVLIDGWHRVEAAKAAGLHDLPARIVSGDPATLKWEAAAANMRHGLPLKRAEAREVFRVYVRAGQHMKTKRRLKSAREIAADLHGIRSHQTILTWMRGDFPSIYRRMQGSETHGGDWPGTSGHTAEERAMQSIAEHLSEARKAMRVITDPEQRGALIALLEHTVAEMRKLGPWTPASIEEAEPQF